MQIELLGTRVELQCEDPVLREQLLESYARSIREDRTEAETLRASLRGTEPPFEVDIEERGNVTCGDRALALATFHHDLLHALMRRQTALFYVHAGVVALNGSAIVLPGISRAGKSTLSLALVLSGARLLSDEILAFDSKTAEAQCFPRAIKIRDECLEYFPSLSEHFHGEGAQRVLSFAALPPDVVQEKAPIQAIVTPQWSLTGDNAPVPVRPGEALMDLASSALNFGTHEAKSLVFLSELVQGKQTFRIFWSDPHAAARQIALAVQG